eukprot:scaffold324507_cov36-Prasinocladus_malaysianus.AAC.1
MEAFLVDLGKMHRMPEYCSVDIAGPNLGADQGGDHSLPEQPAALHQGGPGADPAIHEGHDPVAAALHVDRHPHVEGGSSGASSLNSCEKLLKRYMISGAAKLPSDL